MCAGRPWPMLTGMKKILTAAPVVAGDFSGVAPEFGRVRDVTKLFGLRRGTIYNLLSRGRIKGCVLRVCGSKSGVRVIDLASVRQFITAEMAHQNGERSDVVGREVL